MYAGRVNLTQWTHAQGIHVRTVCRWYREGTLPVPAQKAGRLILVSPETATEAARKTNGAGLHARVSSHDQKSGLDGQVARLSAWAATAGLPVVRVEAEAGSGLNGSRVKGRRMLADPAMSVVVAGHRDRLGQMNTGLVEAALAAHNRRPVVPGDSEATEDLVRDVVEVLTLLCAGLCGCRSARSRALTALGCAQHDIGRRTVKLQRQATRRPKTVRGRPPGRTPSYQATRNGKRSAYPESRRHGS
jgi:putative resolvase